MSELELLLVNQARKSNPNLHRRTDGEILQMFRDNKMPDGQTDDSIQIDQSILSNDTPKYRIRDQLKRDFLEGGIFKDAYKSLGQSKDALVEDFSSLTEGLGSIKDRGIDFASYMKDKGIDLGKWANETKNNIIIGNDNMKSFCINAIDTLVRKISEQQTQIAYLSAELEKLREKKGSKK